MTRRDIEHRQAPVVIHYPQPVQPPGLVLFNPAEVEARRHEQNLMHARWLVRQRAIQARDERNRRLMWRVLGVAACVALVGCSVLGVLAWQSLGWVVEHLAAIIAVAVLVLLGTAVGGHRCVTIVKHWH